MDPRLGEQRHDSVASAEYSQPPAPPFVGRHAELQLLQGALRDAEGGRRRLLLLAGDAGIGKTRLAEELAARAQTIGAVIVWGRCWEAGGAPAYWPWVQIVRALTDGRDPAAIERLAGHGAPALRELLGELSERDPSPPGAQGDVARFHLFDSVTTFLSKVAGMRPLVLIFDDLHAADRPSLLMLHFLARERRGSRLLMIGTYRDVEAHREASVSPLITALAREGRVVHLGGLALPEVRRFMRDTTGTEPGDDLVQLVHRTTEGNPFFLDEVVRFLDAEDRVHRWTSGRVLRIPHEARETICRRLHPLPPDVLEVLAVAAVIGREFDIALLQPVCEQPTEPLLDLLGAAISAGVLTKLANHPGRFSFAHTLIRDTLYDDLSPARRMQLHRRVGETLERLHPFERAAEVASTVAIGEALRCDLLLSMGDAQAKVGESSAARETFERAATAARNLGSPERLALAALGCGGPQPPGGVFDPALDRLLGEALDALGDGDSPLRSRLLSRRAMDEYYASTREERDAATAEAVAIARRLDDRGALAYALHARCYSLWGLEDVEARLDAAKEILQLARQVGDRELALQGHSWRIIALLERADLTDADAEIETYARIAAELRQPYFLWEATVFRAMRALLDGRLLDAERLAVEALHIGQREHQTGDPEAGSRTRLGLNAPLAYSVQLFNLRNQQGRLRELEDTVRGLVREYPTLPVWRCALAHLLCGPDTSDEVRALFDSLAAADFSDLPRDGNWLVAVTLLAEVCAFLGDADRAALLHNLLRPHAGRQIVIGNAYVCRGAVAHYLGLLAATMDADEQADCYFRSALAMHERMGARTLIARTRAEWGQALLNRGGTENLVAASRLLEQAFATFWALDLPIPARQAAERLVALGPQPAAADRASHPAR